MSVSFTMKRKILLYFVSGAFVIASITSCSSSGVINSDRESSPTVAPTTITIDNAGVVPVFANSSTSTVVYVHNNSSSTVSGITYSSTITNAASKNGLSSKSLSLFDSNKINNHSSNIVSGSQCSTIAAGQSCPLSITTPVLSGTATQGSMEIRANYIQNNKLVTFTQLINYAQVQNNLQTSGAKFQAGVSISGYGNSTGYGTIYLYGSGQNQIYNVSSIIINKPAITIANGDISGHQIQSNFVQAVELASPISNSSISAIITVNSSTVDSSTVKNSKSSSSKSTVIGKSLLEASQFSSSVDLAVEPVSAGAILTTGYVPLINTANSTSGSMLIRNAGNQSAEISTVTAEAGISNLSGCSNTTLASGETCTIKFNVTESGGSANIIVPYSGGSTASVIGNVTWFNGTAAALVSMFSSENPITFVATELGSATITITNIGGYSLSNINIPTPIVVSGNANATLGSNNCATIESLPINGHCEYVVNLEDSKTDIGKQINVGFSASYAGVGGTKTYSRILPVSYTSTSNGAVITINPTNPSLTISGNSVESTTQVLTISNSGNLPANISTSLTSNPAYLTENSTNCSATLAAESSCTSIIKFGPTYSSSGASGASTYTVNYTAGGQTPSGSVISNLDWTVQSYSQSISLESYAAFGHTSGNGETEDTQYEFTARGRDVVGKSITLTYANTGTGALKITGIQDSNSVYTWQIGGNGTSCFAGTTILQPNDTCKIVYTSVFESNILALGASVGTTYQENLIVPTLIYQDNNNPSIQFSNQPNLPFGGTTLYAQSNQATLANMVTVNGLGTVNESVTISHLLANADDALNVTVRSKMENYFVIIPPTVVGLGECTLDIVNGILTQTCIMGKDNLSMSATYMVNQTLLTPDTDLNLSILFSTDPASQIVSMNPIYTISNLGNIPLIYFASNGLVGYNGNLLAQAQARAALPNQPAFTGTTGVAAADYLCNTDESKPILPSGVLFKALIVAEGQRQACAYGNDNCTTPNGNNIDWVMNPNANYLNTKNRIIGATNGAGVFTFNTTNLMAIVPSSFSSAMAFTGLSENWLNTDYASCNSWTSEDPNVFGLLGLIGSDLGAPQISSQIGDNLCNASQNLGSINGLYCVQQ